MLFEADKLRRLAVARKAQGPAEKRRKSVVAELASEKVEEDDVFGDQSEVFIPFMLISRRTKLPLMRLSGAYLSLPTAINGTQSFKDKNDYQFLNFVQVSKFRVNKRKRLTMQREIEGVLNNRGPVQIYKDTSGHTKKDIYWPRGTKETVQHIAVYRSGDKRESAIDGMAVIIWAVIYKKKGAQLIVLGAYTSIHAIKHELQSWSLKMPHAADVYFELWNGSSGPYKWKEGTGGLSTLQKEMAILKKKQPENQEKLEKYKAMKGNEDDTKIRQNQTEKIICKISPQKPILACVKKESPEKWW